MPPRATSSSGRNLAIDCLRGLSIALVFYAHSNRAGPYDEPLLIPTRWLHTIQLNGGLGVSIFFVISGFLITRTALLRYGHLRNISVPAFYGNRIARIFPLLILLVLLNLVGAALLWPDFVIPPEISISKLLTYVFSFRFNLFYLIGGAILTTWAPLWSLAVEEVFYAAFPLVAKITRGGVVLILLLLALLIFGPYYRLKNGWGGFYLYWGCFDLISMGCLTALLANSAWAKRQAKHRSALLGLAALVGSIVYLSADMHRSPHWVWLPTSVGFCAAVFLFAAVLEKTATPSPTISRLAWLPALAGMLSYEIYLFHMPILAALRPRLHPPSGPLLPFPRDMTVPAIFLVLVGFGAILHFGYGEPIRSWLRRKLVSRPPGAS